MLICLLSAMSSFVYAAEKDVNDYALMSARDIKENTLSNISITNKAAQVVPTAGLFIASYDVVTAGGNCSSCFGNITGGDNAGGAYLSPVTFKVNQTVPIGQNFLYNMLYNGIYFVRSVAGSTPCNLPGCSWPGDDPNVTGWCISINVISKNSSYTYSNYTNGSNPPANALPYGAPGSSPAFEYNYDLINPNTLGAGNACFGPIVCNDQSLTCTVSNPQNESFQPYSSS